MATMLKEKMPDESEKILQKIWKNRRKTEQFTNIRGKCKKWKAAQKGKTFSQRKSIKKPTGHEKTESFGRKNGGYSY